MFCFFCFISLWNFFDRKFNPTTLINIQHYYIYFFALREIVSDFFNPFVSNLRYVQ